MTSVGETLADHNDLLSFRRAVAQTSNMHVFLFRQLAWNVTSITTFVQIEGNQMSPFPSFRLWVHLDLNIRGAWSESFAFSYRLLNAFHSFWHCPVNREGLHTSVSYQTHSLCLYFHNRFRLFL